MPKTTKSPSSPIKNLLRQSGLHARKRLGQHFLTDEKVLQSIISASEITRDDTVIEVGPGLGTLTDQLIKLAGHVFAIELDDSMAARLKNKYGTIHNVEVINADILKVDLAGILGERKEYKVVANLPYYITSPVLHYFVYAARKPELMVVMMQKEVADNIVAAEGKISYLAISLGIYTKPRIIDYVPATSFYPPPAVDSAIVRFDFFKIPAVKVDDLNLFLELVRRGFRSPRKQLRNSLADGMKVATAVAMKHILESNIDPGRRPETLSFVEWQRLYESIKSAGLL